MRRGIYPHRRYTRPVTLMAGQNMGSGVLAGGYTQNRVDNGGAAWLSDTTPPAQSSTFTFSGWVRPAAIGSNVQILAGGQFNALRVEIKILGELGIRFIDSSSAQIIDTFTTNQVFSAGVLAHVYVALDVSTPSSPVLDVEIDGSPEALDASPSTTTDGLIDYGGEFTFLADENEGELYDGEVGDFFVDTSQIVSNQFIDGNGDPVDPSGIGSPFYLLGDTMVAADWNNGDNLGSGGSLTVTGTFTDV